MLASGNFGPLPAVAEHGLAWMFHARSRWQEKKHDDWQ
jgi:hypothetical protein